MIDILPLAAYDDNYIWLLRDGGHVIAIDPGDAAPVARHLADSGDRLAAILVTHHHGDHVGGVGSLAAAAACPVYGPAAEDIPGVTVPLAGGEVIHLTAPDLELTVIAVPGHTRGHLAYHAPALNALFCGDTLFGAGCGRLFEGTAAQMRASLACIAALPTPTLVYCAHEYTLANLRFATAVEPDNLAVRERVQRVDEARSHQEPTVPSTLAEELATNPFLRWEAPAVIAAASSRLGHAPSHADETFAAIREWKNQFR